MKESVSLEESQQETQPADATAPGEVVPNTNLYEVETILDMRLVTEPPTEDKKKGKKKTEYLIKVIHSFCCFLWRSVEDWFEFVGAGGKLGWLQASDQEVSQGHE
jgi:hypothetical protein